VIALYGDPSHLDPKHEAKVKVKTEVETGPVHSVFFNRGSVATQEYAHRFLNKPPSVAGPDAYEWLSRGLLEALAAFLNRAGPGCSIHGGVYEFQWPSALEAIKKVSQAGAEVKILFDDIGSGGKGNAGGPWKRNRDAITKAGIKTLCKGITNGTIMHNKFFIFSRNGEPKAVWTGSTNLTENGIFGHSNVGHIVEDPAIARAFMEYWQRLDRDPKIDEAYRGANVAASPAPPIPWNAVTHAVFSPRRSDLDALDWFA
jgi:hypothetical protein